MCAIEFVLFFFFRDLEQHRCFFGVCVPVSVCVFCLKRSKTMKCRKKIDSDNESHALRIRMIINKLMHMRIQTSIERIVCDHQFTFITR